MAAYFKVTGFSVLTGQSTRLSIAPQAKGNLNTALSEDHHLKYDNTLEAYLDCLCGNLNLCSSASDTPVIAGRNLRQPTSLHRRLDQQEE